MRCPSFACLEPLIAASGNLVMKLHYQQSKNTCTLRPDGDFTIYSAAEFRDTLLQALCGDTCVDIDLAAVGEIDGAGLQLLLVAAADTAAAGKKLRLIAPGPAVMDTLKLCNVESRFEITGSDSGGKSARTAGQRGNKAKKS